ncbi:hypothetical protein [Pontibacter diazotrophicus]|uniref:hypothetical protein n=1 Tax=Pontibacter diazotrophicus TaxID=1400979 RepID=UPI0015F14562|nr:hypothetical protein [Pontibacter diazotrophicus]
MRQRFNPYKDTDAYLTDAIYVHLLQEHQELQIEGAVDFFKREDAFCASRIIARQFSQSPVQERIAACLIASSRHREIGAGLIENLKDLLENELALHPQTGLVKDVTHTIILLYAIARLGVWAEDKLNTQITLILGKGRVYRGLDIVFLTKLASLLPQNKQLATLVASLFEISLAMKDAEEKLFVHYARLWHLCEQGEGSKKEELLSAIAFIEEVQLEDFQTGAYFDDYNIPNKWRGSIYPCFLLGYAKMILNLYQTIMSEDKIQAELRDYEQLVDDNGKQAMLQSHGDQFKGNPFKVLKHKDKFRIPYAISIQNNDTLWYEDQPFRITDIKNYQINGVVVAREVSCEAVTHASPAPQTNQLFNYGGTFQNAQIQLGGSGNSQQQHITEAANTDIIIKLIDLLQELPRQELPVEVIKNLDAAKTEAAKSSPIWSKVQSGVKGALAWAFNNPDKAGTLLEKINYFISQHGHQIGSIIPLS